ncbi:MAG: hypothetical protein VX447_16395 [Pseudomonadota bacterium]|uniref:hypothetical protein n=1 Tax=Gallaecimonas pentaromativorans TaxID=584787 RepID=UPI00067E9DF4|nr:hypothetical protein [Gallaecimonas pentaromativorans]MED5526316.1 hypothetical protein [Pseudomonadota bacterium]
MPTITLVHNADNQNGVHNMRGQPGGIPLTGLAGDHAVFTCTNPLATIQGITSVDIVYNTGVPAPETIQVSSVQP